jgi:hypothetical protein
MPIAFPANPSTNQTYTYSGQTWIWTGQNWRRTAATTSNTNVIYGSATSATSFIAMPVGTTAQRPASPGSGYTRYNSTSLNLEYFDASYNTWMAVNKTVIENFFSADYLVVAGGGGGGHGTAGGGGGAGGFITGNVLMSIATPTTVTIGSGGANTNTDAVLPTNGSNSIFASFTAIGGGYGGNESGTAAWRNGNAGGSGGGAVYNGTGGTGTPGQGYSGGTGTFGGSRYSGGGGGGAGAIGFAANSYYGGAGGVGSYSTITGANVAYAGGGGGALAAQTEAEQVQQIKQDLHPETA